MDGTKLRLSEKSVIIIEGIHALNPILTSDVPDKNKFKIYVSALTSLSMDHLSRISTTDNRLLRRIVRDSKYRNHTALQTLQRWGSVRRGEEKNVFPFQDEADYMFNSALFYEISVCRTVVAGSTRYGGRVQRSQKIAFHARLFLADRRCGNTAYLDDTGVYRTQQF